MPLKLAFTIPSLNLRTPCLTTKNYSVPFLGSVRTPMKVDGQMNVAASDLRCLSRL